MKKSQCITALLFTLLCGALALALTGSYRTLPPASLHIPLKELIPKEVPGWSVADQPIADTPELQKAVTELLNYDDGLFRTYSAGDRQISVYIAYWRPGKMSARLIAGHTPDVCWINSGWTCLASKSNHIVEIPDLQLKGGQWRLFEQNKIKLEVVFWHLQQRQSVLYLRGTQPPWWSMFSDLAKRGINQRGEQLFIRLSSNQSLAPIWNQQPLRAVIESLAPLGLKLESNL